MRLLAEMNQANNGYSAFDRNGRHRGPAHATSAFRNAWRRSALILRGGPVAAIDARPRSLGCRPCGAPATSRSRGPKWRCCGGAVRSALRHRRHVARP